jgi:site-specific recombinase XerD
MNIPKWRDLAWKDLQLKYNSEATVKNYHSCINQFLSHFKDEIDPQHIDNGKIKEWLLGAKTINTRKHRLNALRFFYLTTVGMKNKVHQIPYPKADKKLPIVLSQSEVQSMFDVCGNAKHRVILSILYACGLRVSELINLKWEHIDRSRLVINIIQAKGNKDRQVPLPLILIPLLEKYWREYKPKVYVLNGQNSLQYSERSVGEVIKQLAEKAGIKKRVYTHLMRHNCFTHLLESGVDISIIQKIAGHSNPRTTQIYTHISHNLISSVNTPLNNIRI